MPQAGGEYVKLYLCLLRHAADYGSIPLESIAELFDYTERDIYRGLQYWADQGLIDLAFDQDGSISDLVFLEVRKPESVQQAAASVSSGVLPASAKAPVSKMQQKKRLPNRMIPRKQRSFLQIEDFQRPYGCPSGRTGYQATPADRRILPRAQSFAD